ncbi:FAD-dependent oxidoreductase [Desulfotomaculum copahuensis]|uniref:NADH:flavin oxidoreductase n=1 Tax=Desulfotomaculum copahuensis TaxID=1838280 RepID=A0A1B7LHR3_9FIRM|nr:FAD-dependent oxidoreductase [Desulfotomaculum copahuensis]OAT85840.1 NADH:flavin oxidoreductase [Desulfotomaculum copahuensis]
MLLFSPVKVGSLQLKNRLVMPAMHLGYCRDGEVSTRLVDFYARRAEGGAGLIIVGGCAVDEHGYPSMISAAGDRYIPGLARLAAAIKEGGSASAAQLFQPGRYSYAYLEGIEPVAPSALASRLTGRRPRELTTGEIHRLIDAFARAAFRVKQAGFDAVEVIASAGYLISQFLSPLTNQRQDEFGGDPARRMHFGLSVARRVREAVGAEFPVIFRISGHEFMSGGNTTEEIILFCRQLEDCGVDMFNVTGGWHETPVPQITMDVPRGAFVYLARQIRQAVSVPVTACNRINHPALAEKILSDGSADLVGMARALIADPDLPEKARTGKWEEIRPCIGCNQGCLDAVFGRRDVCCLVNPRAGRESAHRLQPALRAKRVLVVGGGPAGMEAARVAAVRGHRVTLWEKSGRLGGQLNLAAVPPGRGEFKTLVGYLCGQLDRLGVEVCLNREATAENVTAGGFDAVVVAAGAQPAVPQIPGVHRPHVVQAHDLLAGRVTAGRRVVVAGGGAVGCETALFLASRGTLDAAAFYFLAVNRAEQMEKLLALATCGAGEVTLLARSAVGKDIGQSTRWVIMQSLHRFGVRVISEAGIVSIDEDGVLYRKGEREKKVPADTVVLAAGSLANSMLGEELKEKVREIYVVGDAIAPRHAMEAIAEGFCAGEVL